MKFVGKAWKLLVGIKDGLVLIFMLIFFGGLYAALSASPHRGSASRGALRLDLAGAIVEQPSVRSPLDAIGGGNSRTREYRVSELIHALDEAATDDHVQAVALDLDSFTGGGQTAITDVGAALDRFRRANKRVVAYATGYGDDGYQLAAHADEVWLDPLGAVLIAGPGGANLYYAGPAPAARHHRQRLSRRRVQVGGRALYPQRHVARGARGQPGARQRLVGHAGSRTSTRRGRARRSPLMSPTRPPSSPPRAATWRGRRSTRAWSTMSATAPPSAGAWPSSPAPTMTTCRAATAPSITSAWVDDHPASRSGGEIAVLTVAGTIVDGNAPAGTAGGDTIARNLERGLEHGNIKALVVRVDSPGGSVTASERIRRAILGGAGARHPGGDLDGLGRRVGRLLDLDRGRRHLRRALDDHRIDRRVRHLAELPGHAAKARHRRRRRDDDAALRPARSAARPLPRGEPAAPDGGRGDLPALHHARRQCAAPGAGAGQRDRPGPGLGRRHRPPARPGRPVRQFGRRHRRGGAARPSRAGRRASRLPRKGAGLARPPVRRRGARRR